MGKRIKNRRVLKKNRYKTIMKQIRKKPNPIFALLRWSEKQVELALTGFSLELKSGSFYSRYNLEE